MCLNRFLIVKALVDTFDKEKALEGAFSGHDDQPQVDVVPMLCGEARLMCDGDGVN